MWSFKCITFVWCLMLVSSAWTLPTAKIDNELDAQKPEQIIAVDVIQMPADEKPNDNSKPSEMAVDPKPIEVKPTEQTKPNEAPSASSAPTTTILETIPLSVGPPRRQFLYDQRQDGKYNIRADLENFVILVVPSSGNSLLDLLKRSGQRQPQQHHNKRQHHTKHHKKYHTASASKSVEVKKASNRLDYLNRPEGEAETPAVGEFIEGRTPYHVDIQSDEILQPAAYATGGVRSIADLPLINLDENIASSTSGASDPTIVTVTDSSSPRLPKSITNGGYGNPFSNGLNTVILTPNIKSYGNDYHDNKPSKNYNNYFSRKNSVQIVDRNPNLGVNERQNDNYNNGYGNDMVVATKLINSPTTTITSDSIDLTDSKTSFNSLNVGNIDRLALAGDSTRKTDADLANAQWELTLLGAEEQCGPDRRRDSYGVCQFVPADYATT
ncbi:uncharacterized protein LOC129565183 [Sitodiplosis mosellana]|uniref:uncharacterized protein LOC129565183 n=1 Tax=Sitodiplosis mosellana TaxID=263140 RepID=UPI002444393C|nr:uncharacterized protein LOC129565183 [Sitodiplosis mosellana]